MVAPVVGVCRVAKKSTAFATCVGRDLCLEQVAVLIVGLEPGLIQAPGLHALGAHLGPQAGAAGAAGEHRVGRHHVHPHVVGGQLQAGDARQLVGRRLGGAVGAEVGPGAEHVLGRDQHDVAAGAPAA